jgi:superfamily II DNA/RNA helicase
MTTFADLGVPARIASSLAARDITTPFPIQEASIPDALAGKDILGKAPTGSGKTLAFGIPLVTLVERSKPGRPRALVLAPTRELAEQIAQELMPLAKKMDRWVLAVYGGVGYDFQRRQLRRGADIVVATPGRLTDLIDEGTLSLERVDIAVIDEADRMADMGFMPQVKKLLDQMPTERQTILFSATLDGDVGELIRRYQKDPCDTRSRPKRTTPWPPTTSGRSITTSASTRLPESSIRVSRRSSSPRPATAPTGWPTSSRRRGWQRPASMAVAARGNEPGPSRTSGRVGSAPSSPPMWRHVGSTSTPCPP